MPWRWLAASGVAIAIVVLTSSWLNGRPVRAGEANLDFTLTDMDGREVSLASFRGRPIVLNFWATWCGPCKAEIPALVAMADAYKAQHLIVLGVSVDDPPEALRPFAAEFRMNYPVLVGRGHDEFQETYDALIAVPVTWFIRADGSVQLKHKGPATKAWLEEQIRALVAPVQSTW